MWPIVDHPAYRKSTFELRGGFSRLPSRANRWNTDSSHLNATFDYNIPEVVSNTGRRRKELVQALAHSISRCGTRRGKCYLTLGERADRPLASSSGWFVAVN